MLSAIRTRGSLLFARQCQTPVLRAYSSAVTDHPVPTNDPSKENRNVLNTNAVPISSTDTNGQELPDEREQRIALQAPNRTRTWSRSQQPRSKAMVGPRFEQTIMEDQVRYRVATAYC
ncbi:hypothetical protein GP486_001652 [Trichoglossum hirsutum]|uniref:Uncharacterized protein n=1 Tax=Trichoglossum hirsutum TaxID=265104 RepID=A0A9P8RSF2_9PEZI|nr:hypothetical protein GP486_001652 [Trichoglossum hirsutum]